MKKDLQLEINKQNAEEIRKKILEETKIQTKEIFDFAKEEVQKILDEANQKIQEEKQRILSDLDSQTQAIKDRIFSALNLEKRRVILEEKNKFVKDVLSKVEEQAKQFRKSQDYRLFLKKAIADALSVIDEKSLVVFYSELDEKLIDDEFRKDAEDFCRKNLNAELSLKFKKSGSQDIGVVVESNDGRLIYDNTFLSRLRRVYDEIYIELMRAI